MLTEDVQHLSSRIHRVTVVACPFCKCGFVAASGVSHHLKTGSCTDMPGLDRNTIYRVVREHDPHGVITHKQLEWYGETHAHLNSPAHQQKIYHCPSRQCDRPSVSLAAMFNHLESESCGFVIFEKVQQDVNGILTGRQRFVGFA